MTAQLDRNAYRKQVLAGVGDIARMSPDIVKGYQTNSALSVGLIGCGRRGTAITEFFAQNEFAKVAALCDIYDDQIAQAAQKFSGARHFKDLNDVLASDVDAVYIALKDLKKVVASSPDEVRRQAIVVLSDGEDTSSLLPFE